jgi:hypothetical protein
MNLNSDNLEVYAARFYMNPGCISKEEFLEDLYHHKTIKRLARKISKGNSKNLRLLTNHIISFTNNFEPVFAKSVLMMEGSEHEKKVIRAVLLYLGFLSKTEYTAALLDFETIKMLKEMDK